MSKKSEEKAQTVIRLSKGQREKIITQFGGIQKMVDFVLGELPDQPNELYAILPEKLRPIYKICLEEDRTVEVETGRRSLLSHHSLTEAIMVEMNIIDERRVHRYLLQLQRFGVLKMRFSLFDAAVRVFRDQAERDRVLGKSSNIRQARARRALAAAVKHEATDTNAVLQEPTPLASESNETDAERDRPGIETGKPEEAAADGLGVPAQQGLTKMTRRRDQACHGA